MSTTRIKYLIELFYEGTLSEQEEKELYTYFLQEDIPAELKDDKKIFISLYHANKDIPVPTDLNNKLEKLIDSLEKKEKQSRRKYLFSTLSGIAAGIVLLVFLGWLVEKTDFQKEKSIVLADTYSDPQEAYEETKKTLLLVSAKLNSGINKLEETENKINKIINKKISYE